MSMWTRHWQRNDAANIACQNNCMLIQQGLVHLDDDRWLDNRFYQNKIREYTYDHWKLPVGVTKFYTQIKLLKI